MNTVENKASPTWPKQKVTKTAAITNANMTKYYYTTPISKTRFLWLPTPPKQCFKNWTEPKISPGWSDVWN